MIRFSCPGCGATYTVGDEKGGKTGKCPKCQTQFVIPMPEAAAAPAAAPPPVPPPPPAPEDPNATVEIKPCPGCQARLSVTAADLGVDVECPYCKTVYKAVKAGTGAAPPVPSKRSDLEDAGGRRRRRDEEDEDDRPSRRRRDEEDEDRPSRRRRDEDDEERPSRRRRDEDEDEDRPSRRRRRDEDEEDEDDRPRRRRRRRLAGDYAPHRGGTILVYGILGLVCCIIFAILAAIQGSQDLAKMDRGEMDPDGRTMTRIGQILGFVGIGLAIVGVVLNLALGGFARR